jgi:hypothetical protein
VPQISPSIISDTGKARKQQCSWHQGLRPVILATQEADIRRIEVQSQAEEIVCKTLS